MSESSPNPAAAPAHASAPPPAPAHGGNLPPLAGGWPRLQPGWVWLCGAGPGDAGLLTLHALNALGQAEVIVCDALVDRAVLGWASPAAEIIFAGKRGGRPSPLQKDISQLLVRLAQADKRVLRLKGGDPFLFGRGAEEAQALLRQGVPFRVVPGISAGIGGLACAGIALTRREAGNAVSFVSGHEPGAVNWAALAQASPVMVIYMGMRHIGAIAAALLAAGRSGDEPVVVVADASLPHQKVLETTLAACAGDVARHAMKAPAIICIGPVADLHQLPGWQALTAATGQPKPPPPTGGGA